MTGYGEAQQRNWFAKGRRETDVIVKSKYKTKEGMDGSVEEEEDKYGCYKTMIGERKKDGRER